jgi:hypothetical protein
MRRLVAILLKGHFAARIQAKCFSVVSNDDLEGLRD